MKGMGQGPLGRGRTVSGRNRGALLDKQKKSTFFFLTLVVKKARRTHSNTNSECLRKYSQNDQLHTDLYFQFQAENEEKCNT